MEKTRRVKIVTGLKCNIKCVFCYYRDSLTAPNRTVDEIADDLRYAYSNDVREVDFSGGEPTVHPDLPRLIAMAKEIGMERVCIISNGQRLADPKYLQSLENAGLDEVLFSVHGSRSDIHDEITQIPGSFEKLRRGMANVAETDLDVRVNTVVNRLNCPDLPPLSELLLIFGPVQVNFITLNDWCFAKHLIDKFMVTYTEMAPSLKSACDLLEPAVPAVNVRYIPFCFMQGYERFVCDHRQVVYDPYEWVPRVRARLEEGTSLMRYLGILGYGFTMGGGWLGLFGKPLPTLMDDCVVDALRSWFYTKDGRCRSCAFNKICDGVEKTYAAKYGTGELTPCSGAFLTDPVTFRRGNRDWCVG